MEIEWPPEGWQGKLSPSSAAIEEVARDSVAVSAAIEGDRHPCGIADKASS